MHTKYSDGLATIEEMAERAKKIGYEYIAITDHSQSQKIAGGINADEIKEQWNEIEKIEDKIGLKILKGAEVDILSDGSLDYDNKILNQLDIVLASVHTKLKSSREEMTNRILKALENKNVNILAHPTGRVINKREPFNFDFDKVFSYASKNKVLVEINANPKRLDLNDKMILKAKKYNVIFSLGTDAHDIEGLDDMKYGVLQARRGWLTKNDVINSLNYDDLSSFLHKR